MDESTKAIAPWNVASPQVPVGRGAAPEDDDVVPIVEHATRSALVDAGPVVLAVSGGIDSMTLLAAAQRAARDSVVAVATFDHGTGLSAQQGAALAVRETERFGIPCFLGHATRGRLSREAEWRHARWTFLNGVARRFGARVATAHHGDDQIETVVMRLLRHAGARGLAGMYARSAVVRPFLSLPREAILAYARRQGVEAVDDPSNASRAHLRNRVRLDLLPALRRAHPRIDAEVLAIARAAADWRSAFEQLVDRIHPVFPGDAPGVRGAVAAPPLVGYDLRTLAVLWPVLAARMGCTLDWRGTRRLAEFTIEGKTGGMMQVSGGITVSRTPFWFVFRSLSELGGPMPDLSHGAMAR